MNNENHIFQGLKRDNHQIKQQPEFLWDAHNIRLTNRDDSTLLSITNERGPSPTGIGLSGQYVGHCVIGKYLVVFTASGNSSHTIYRIEKTDTGFHQITLFHNSSNWDKGWDTEHPIEALGIYETKLVQKVYWIDGKNQPRVINITKPELTGEYDDDRLDYTGIYSKSEFDFVRSLKLRETITVSKGSSEGMFAPGVIQYALSYYNKYGQETNIFYTSPLQYITYPNRGGSPEDRIATSFRITIENPDDFDYVRLYSIHRTSIDAVPTVKLVSDIEILNNNIEIIDTGTIGEIVDNTYLFYVGGREIVPQCMTQKDNHLFFGNIELKEDENFLDVKKAIGEEGAVTFENYSSDKPDAEYKDPKGTYYSYEIHPEVRGFKSNEWYRLGIQFQRDNGNWTEPIFLKDDIVNEEIPYRSITEVNWKTKKIVLSQSFVDWIKKNTNYVKVRTCVVFPKPNERTVICQGVLCPTVFSSANRKNNGVYAMSSWFFRPGCSSSLKDQTRISALGSNIQYAHNMALLGNNYTGSEIQGIKGEYNTNVNDSNVNTDDYNYFFVDENLLTMHSPDIEFDDSIYYIDEYSNYKLHILGFVQLGAIIGDINIETSTPVAGGLSSGFRHSYQGYQVGTDNGNNNGGLVAGNFYEDIAIDTDLDFKYMIFPFNRSGSLNNDSVRTDDSVRTAVLSKKVISNLKYFTDFTPIDATGSIFDIENPQLFSSNELKLTKVWNNYLNKEVSYMGNVDTLSTYNSQYDLYTANDGYIELGEASYKDLNGSGSKEGKAFKTKEPIRIKYKSTPHLVFTLGKTGDNENIYLPPISANNSVKVKSEYTAPDWYEEEDVSDYKNKMFDIGAILSKYEHSSTSLGMSVIPEGTGTDGLILQRVTVTQQSSETDVT